MPDVEQSPTFAAGFDLARQMRKPELRAILRALRWTSGQHIVVAMDQEPVMDVIARIVFHETDGRALIAVSDSPVAGEPGHFKFMIVEVAAELPDRPDGNALNLGHGASIGMLYDAIHPFGTYIPSEWVKTLQFERVTAKT